MNFKKITQIITAALIFINLCGCQSRNSSSSKEVSQSNAVAISLKNFMTETERNNVSIGELTLLEEDESVSSSSDGENAVEIQWWNNDDYRKYFEENKDNFSDEEYSKLIKDLDKSDEEGGYNIANTITVDGSLYTGFYPPYEYDGGKLEYYITTSDSETDENGTKELSNETEHVEFDSFDEFKEWYRKHLDSQAKAEDITQEMAEQTYTDMLIVFKSVIDGTWKEFSGYAQTTNILAEYYPGSKRDWEYTREEVEEIKDYVREMSIYDEELESDFIIHITLPPDFNENKTYPMFMLSDGVWRFGNCPSLRKLMENGEIEDVILVTIGYDYNVNGSEVGVRAKYFYEEREKFIDFITNNLTPYLGEIYNIDFNRSAFYGHSAGGVLSHNAAFTSDLYENQPFKYYIIGSPALWEIHRLDTEEDPDAYMSDYGYWDRNATINKILYVCGGENEDPEYEEYYEGYDTTLEGIAHLMERLEEHGDTMSECKIYEDSGHYQYIPEMLEEFLKKYYGK